MRAALLLALIALPAPAADPVAGDIHLNTVPRTVAEAARVAAVTAPASDFSAPEPFELRPGGAATTDMPPGPTVLGQHSANMSPERQGDFSLGRGFFRKLWTVAPNPIRLSDGLGPVYNARSCQSCHFRDGRGHPPEDGADAVSLFLRLSVPGDAATAPAIAGTHATAPDPVYGGQLQNFAIPGVPAEGRMTVTYTEEPVTLAGGEVVMLRRPAYGVEGLAHGPLAPGILLSPRLTPAMTGLGLLEAIPAADILARADEDDRDGDGISGRANIVISAEFGRPMLGRFGLKAGTPTIRQQVADAFHGDMGLSSPLHPEGWGDCGPAAVECRAALPGGDPDTELDDMVLDLATFYSRNLAVPARRDPGGAGVLRGKAVFHGAGCPACHTPKFVTHRLEDQPEQSFQLIWPWSDLLLHDMGEGLADHRPEGRASGTEWRTAPLWGIGLAEIANGNAVYLHDGRARSLMEAILWHGGEAGPARDRVAALPKADRDALIAFLGSL